MYRSHSLHMIMYYMQKHIVMIAMYVPVHTYMGVSVFKRYLCQRLLVVTHGQFAFLLQLAKADYMQVGLT